MPAADLMQKARESMWRAEEATRKARETAETDGVPWTLVESTLNDAARRWERAAEACHAAGMKGFAKHSERQARNLVYG